MHIISNRMLTLKRTRELLSDPNKWNQFANMFDANGKVTIDFRRAESYCLLGAINVCALGDTTAAKQLQESIEDNMLFTNEQRNKLTAWNDDQKRTHEEVLLLLDKTMTAMKESEE